ncbi:MAG: lysylphosphatidylglycerol synthase transmembrane domain-containing protein [bacterium]|nr:lysylphosphatidylglycerol synthase transmembrane domain-containing protein [bacterium]
MKNIRLKSAIITIITILILIFLLKDNFLLIIKEISNINIMLFLISIILYIAYFLIDNLVLYLLTKTYNKNIKLKKILRIGIETKFFNGITPLASGGQPWQVYKLGKEKIKYVDGTSIVSQNYLLFQIAMMIITTTCLIISKSTNIFHESYLIDKITLIGFIINLLMLGFLLFIGLTKKTNYKIIKFFVKILAKLKIIKNYEISVKRWEKRCNTYRENTLKLLKNKKIFIQGIILYLISTSIYYILPYFIFLSLNITNISVEITYIANALIFIAGCCMPLPGASGGMEYAYFGYFTYFLTNESTIFSSLIIWRLVTFYLPTIIGGIFFLKKEKNKKT